MFDFADFGGVRFLDTVSFFSATFGGNVWFNSTQFSNSAWLDKTRFSGFVKFLQCTFKGNTSLSYAQFKQEADLSRLRRRLSSWGSYQTKKSHTGVCMPLRQDTGVCCFTPPLTHVRGFRAFDPRSRCIPQHGADANLQRTDLSVPPRFAKSIPNQIAAIFLVVAFAC